MQCVHPRKFHNGITIVMEILWACDDLNRSFLSPQSSVDPQNIILMKQPLHRVDITQETGMMALLLLAIIGGRDNDVFDY